MYMYINIKYIPQLYLIITYTKMPQDSRSRGATAKPGHPCRSVREITWNERGPNIRMWPVGPRECWSAVSFPAT